MLMSPSHLTSKGRFPHRWHLRMPNADAEFRVRLSSAILFVKTVC